MAPDNPIIGIDFGTNKSVVSVMQGGEVKIIPDLQDRLYMPSLVMVGPEDHFYIGWDAINHPDRYKSRHFTISSIKRQMGKAGEISWGNFKTYPQEISALIFGRLKMQAEAYLDCKIDQAVVAVPANFDVNQRWATMQAAEIAGLKVLRMLNEATAAVLSARHLKQKNETVLVFDFGAGTLDVSIIDCGESVYQVRASAGDDRLGGDDFDQLILDHLLEKARKEYGVTSSLSSMEQLVLKEAAIRAKIELSTSPSTRIYIPGFWHGLNKYQDLDVLLERGTFESLCKPLFERAEAVMNWAIKDAGLQPRDFNELFLIGGSSKIPHLRSRVSEMTGLKPSALIHPETGVAEGAGIMAGVLGGLIKDVLLLDITPCTYSVATLGGVATPLIERNTTTPTRKTSNFSTTQDNQTEISIQVIQGEKARVADNNLVGTLTLTGLPPAQKGMPQIEVTFSIDAGDILTVSAIDKATGRSMQAVMTSPHRLNPAQIKWYQRKVSNELETLRKQETQAYDNQRQELARIEAQSFIRDLDQLLATTGKQYTPEQASLLASGRSLILDYLDWNVPSDKLRLLLDSIRCTCREAEAMLLESELILVGQTLAGELKLAGQSPELFQWVQNAASIWQSPSALEACLKQFEIIFKPIVGKSLSFFNQPDITGKDRLKHMIRERLKGSPAATVLLAIILGLFGGQVIRLRGIDTTQPEVRDLLTIYLLGILIKSTPPNRRMAGEELFNLNQAGGGFFLSEYFRNELDPETFSWLKKCLEAIPAEDWLIYYRSLDPEEKKNLVENRIIRQRICLHAISAVSDPTHEVRLAALQNLQEIGVQECIPETLALLSSNKEEAVTLQLMRLLAVTHDKSVVLFLLVLLEPGDHKKNQTISEEVRQAAVQSLEDLGVKECIPEALALLSGSKDEAVTVKLMRLLAATQDKGVVLPLLSLLAPGNQKINQIIPEILAGCRAVMALNIAHFFDLTCDVILLGKPIDFKDRLFLSQIAKKHPELKPAVLLIKETK